MKSLIRLHKELNKLSFRIAWSEIKFRYLPSRKIYQHTACKGRESVQQSIPLGHFCP
jgi:hypothetical protein